MPKIYMDSKSDCVLGRRNVKAQGVQRHCLSLKVSELQVVGCMEYTGGVYSFLVPVFSSYLFLPTFVGAIVD